MQRKSKAEKDSEIAALKADNEALRSKLDLLETRLAALKAAA